jgi:hypothetical protein
VAAINDSAGIFVGGVLDLFNQMELVVARDGDVAHAQAEMLEAIKRVVSTTSSSTAGSGKTITRRKA